MIGYLMFFYLATGQVSFGEPVELDKLMTALDECLMLNYKNTKQNIKRSRTRALLPQVSIGGRIEQNNLEANKLAESSPYLITNFKNGWSVELYLKWSLDELTFSKDEQVIQRDYNDRIGKYIEFQNRLTETYYKLKDVIKRLSETKDPKEIESLSNEYNRLNAKISILTCHKYKSIQQKEE